VLRLSDEEETRVSLDLAGTEGLQKRALNTYLSLRRRKGGCLMICGWEGEPESVRRRRSLGQTRLRLGGAVPLGIRGRPVVGTATATAGRTCGTS